VTELAFDDPCVVFALSRESAAFRREFRPHQRFPGSPCRARFCGPPWLTVLVLETGVGSAPTDKALEWMFEQPKLGDVPYRPRVVLSAGFAGALQPQYKVGDLVLATEVVDAEGNAWPTTWPGELPPGEWQPPLHRARLLTVDNIVAGVEEKQGLGDRHQAAAVDMESAIVASWCKRHEVPFGCLRAISDDAQTPLSPQLADLLAGGRVSLPRVLGSLLMTPGMAGEMWRLARQTQLAAEQLAKALGEVLTLTLPWGGDL
jgi:adenosylhomocysteine nucleosidase